MSETTDEDARPLLELLGDEYVREILVATSDGARSVRELSEELEAARSTVYERTDEMLARDLLVEATRVVEDGSHHSVYRANVDSLSIEVDREGLHAEIETRESASDRFTRMWDGIRGA